jgi:hypothetical protein
MRFDIDYKRAKSMATILQAYLENSPKKLSRSSSIEAVARLLGYNNRNEMAARIDEAQAEGASSLSTVAAYEQIIEEVATWRNDNPMTGEECYNTIRMRLNDLKVSPQPTSSPSQVSRKPREVALEALNDLRISEIEKTARMLVEHGQKLAPSEDFMTAMHEDNPDTGAHTLMDVEDQIIQHLLADPHRRGLLMGIFCESLEMEGARAEGIEDLPSLLARTLVNESMPKAEDFWDEQQD